MPKEIEIDDLRRLLAEASVQVVEVLPSQEFDEEHLPGAVNIPLKELNAQNTATLDRSRPLVVYCWDDA
jgi:rhodanese-related sulfurtransferase